MIKYYGVNKEKSFFQVWYFKHQCNSIAISLVPGIVMDKDGEKRAFIKINYGEHKLTINYDFAEFTFDKGIVRIGENEFSEDGIKVDIKTNKLNIKGEVKFSRVVSLKKRLMGSFNLIKFMQCTHEVISLRHYLNGFLKINGTISSFIDGIGYIETIYGKNMPSEKIWIQCSDKYNYSVMVSLEPVRRGNKNVMGCVAFVYSNGQEHRMTTNKRAKILAYNEEKVIIKQGRKYLEINLHNKKENFDKNKINYLSTKASVLFKMGKRTVFNQNNSKCSYEYNIKKSV